MNFRSAYTYCLAFVLAFQLTDLSRFIYAAFELAPNCPIVGVQDDHDCCVTTSADCGPSPAAITAPTSTLPDPDPAQTPTPPDGEECHTCDMFAVIATFLSIQADAHLIIQSFLEQVISPATIVPLHDIDLLALPRGPPISFLSSS